MACNLPILSYKDIVEGQSSIVQKIAHTLHDVGFFYLTDHGIDKNLISEVKKTSMKFFDLPSEEKERISIYKSPHFRGYSAFGHEYTNGIPDRKEVIDFGIESIASSSLQPSYRALLGPNQWPKQTELKLFKEIFCAYMNSLERIGAQLMRTIAKSLNLAESFFEEQSKGHPYYMMRAIHYSKGAKGSQGVGEHTDFGCLVLLLQDETGGLEVQASSGKWIEAQPIPDTLVVNIGDMLALWSGNHFKATPHRVNSKEGQERYSFPFFYEPGLDTVVRPIIGACKESQIYGEHMFKAFKRSFPEHVLSKDFFTVYPQNEIVHQNKSISDNVEDSKHQQ